jgi:hypothetical protein
MVKKLQPELRIRESCGFALSMSRTPSAEPAVSALEAPLIREAK